MDALTPAQIAQVNYEIREHEIRCAHKKVRVNCGVWTVGVIIGVIILFVKLPDVLSVVAISLPNFMVEFADFMKRL